MTAQKSRLFALPRGDTYPQQLPQIPKELDIQLCLLLAILLPAETLAAVLRSACGGGFLLFDSASNTVDQRERERNVDGSGDARAVFDVERGEVGEELLERAVGDGHGEWGGLDGHGDS